MSVDASSRATAAAETAEDAGSDPRGPAAVATDPASAGTSAIDPEMINEVLDVMISLAKSGMTMVVVTHEMGFARKAADRVVFMSDGAIVEVNTPEQFLTNPQSAGAKDFLGTILTH